MMCLIGMAWANLAHAETAPDSARVVPGLTSVRSVKWGEDSDSEILAHLSVGRPTKSALFRTEYWGADRLPPRWVVTRLVVTMGGDTAVVPFSAYCDLADPTSIAIETTDSTFTVVIKGGRGQWRYSANLLITSPLVLRKRRVESFGSPGKVWEETTYSQFRFYSPVSAP